MSKALWRNPQCELSWVINSTITVPPRRKAWFWISHGDGYSRHITLWNHKWNAGPDEWLHISRWSYFVAYNEELATIVRQRYEKRCDVCFGWLKTRCTNIMDFLFWLVSESWWGSKQWVTAIRWWVPSQEGVYILTCMVWSFWCYTEQICKTGRPLEKNSMTAC